MSGTRWVGLARGSFDPAAAARDPAVRSSALRDLGGELQRTRNAASRVKGDSLYRFWAANPALLQNQDAQARQGRALMEQVSQLDAEGASLDKERAFVGGGGNEQAFVRAWSIYPQRVADGYAARAASMRPARATFGIGAMPRICPAAENLWTWLEALAKRRTAPEALWDLAFHLKDEGYVPYAAQRAMQQLESQRDELRDYLASVLEHELDVYLTEEGENVKLRWRALQQELDTWYRNMAEVDSRLRGGSARAEDFRGLRGEPGVHDLLEKSWQQIVQRITTNWDLLSKLKDAVKALPVALTLLGGRELDGVLVACQMARDGAFRELSFRS